MLRHYPLQYVDPATLTLPQLKALCKGLAYQYFSKKGLLEIEVFSDKESLDLRTKTAWTAIYNHIFTKIKVALQSSLSDQLGDLDLKGDICTNRPLWGLSYFNVTAYVPRVARSVQLEGRAFPMRGKIHTQFKVWRGISHLHFVIKDSLESAISAL